MEEIFKYKSLNKEKLLQYGFAQKGQDFLYQTSLLDDEFLLEILLNIDGIVKTQVFDKKSGEGY